MPESDDNNPFDRLASTDGEDEQEEEEEVDSDEYETDTGGESGSSNDDEDSEEEEEEVSWSLRVRLLSAVDLPPSLSPNVPLCPWFRFGLVEDVNAALDEVEEEKKKEQDRLKEEKKKEQEERKKRTLHPKREGDDEGSEDETDEGGGEYHKKPSSSSQAANAANMNTTTRLLSTLPPSATRTSTSKIMSRNANGGGGNGADWNEDYRWNDLGSPMESCMVVRLCTRLAPEGGAMGGDYGDASSDAGSGGYLDQSYSGETVGGIRGLWRKGRTQLEEHRRRSTMAANPREERAAAVAQYLMRGRPQGDDATAATASTGLSGSDHGMSQQELIEYQKKWGEMKAKEGSGEDYDTTMGGLRSIPSEEEEDDANYAEGLCLGTLTIPLSRLPLEDAFEGDAAAVVEKWYQLDDPNKKKKASEDGEEATGMDEDDEEPTLFGPRRCPSVLLEITFASSDYLDENEEDLRGYDKDGLAVDLASLSLGEQKEDSPSAPVPEAKKGAKEKEEEKKPTEPELERGVIDFLCVVGARDIGNQRSDDGSKGWVDSTPECCVLERYPPTDEFHINNGRNTGLIPQIEWFCFPEGCRLWRGVNAPTLQDLREGGVSTWDEGYNHTPGGQVPTRTLAEADYTPRKFDDTLHTSTSFSWFVLSSNSDVYGSRLVKTYGTVLRFYVPAPKGIDSTQDDFAQTPSGSGSSAKERPRLWVPVGIVVTTTLPIVGIVEEILLRTCKALAWKMSSDESTALMTESGDSSSSTNNSSNAHSIASKLYPTLQKDLYHLIVNFPRPMDGVVHTSIPFLEGHRLHVMTSPLNGLPPLPHGGAVASTCKLLGAEGLTLLLAAALTECRILIHSSNVAKVAMVAEVVTALIFPFAWQLPYIPVLPKDMLEILDAPLPFFVGVPTYSVAAVDRSILADLVVVDLDDGASSDYDSRHGPRTKVPPALPASVSTSISKAVARLLKEEEELEEQMIKNYFPGLRKSPRLEIEDLPERMFRIHVALQICSLVRGYQDCLFFVSASQPVFNRDRFLRQAPALFEDKRPAVLIDSNISDRSQRILSPRSKRFLSVLVNSQHFHQLLERLSSEETAYFHEVMGAIESEEDAPAPTSGSSKSYSTTNFGSEANEKAAQKLFQSLEVFEQKIPTHVTDRPEKRRKKQAKNWTWEDDSDDEWNRIEPFVETAEPFWLLKPVPQPSVTATHNVLRPIMANKSTDPASTSGEAGVHALSLEYLVELEKNPWRYDSIMELPLFGGTEEEGGGEDQGEEKREMADRLLPRITLREAIGEERFKAWKVANDHKDEEDADVTTPMADATDNDGFDLSSILQSMPEIPLEETNQPRADANDRETVRHCLELAFGSNQESINRELISEAELALRNPSAQRYLFSVLNSSLQRSRKAATARSTQEGGAMAQQQGVSRLEPSAFECLVRLCYAVLEACTEEQNYEGAYRLLTLTGGFCTASSGSAQGEQKTRYMTERISIHPIFADLRLWERVLLLHQQDQQNTDRKEDSSENAIKDNEGGDDGEESKPDDADNEDASDTDDAYDAVVTTLYEMVGYGVSAEEVSRFATRISEEKGWFATEKGQALLVLARRLTAKRDEQAGGKPAENDRDSEFLFRDSVTGTKDHHVGAVIGDDTVLESEEIAWSHPSICLVSHERQGGGARAFLGSMLGGAGATADNLGSQSIHGTSRHGSGSQGLQSDGSAKRILNANDHAGRTAITTMASFGGSAVVTGGIDGSVFLAHTINFGADKSEIEFHCPSKDSTCTSPLHSKSRLINGVQLQWGESKTGVAAADAGDLTATGSVTCMAASKGRFSGTDKASSKQGDGDGCPDEEEIISSMDGCWVIAGSTGGSLRCWSLQDVYHSSVMIHRRENAPAGSPPHGTRSQHVSGATSARLGDDFGMREAVSGVAIGGHRGGVTCVDLPPRMYRPDSLISGGEDGLIKLWSLKSPTSGSGDQDGGATAGKKSSIQSRFFHGSQQIGTSITDFDASDAQGVLTGHEGKIICVKTAWHGDKLLSGGADKTVRLWDLSGGGGGKPLTTLRGHQGYVTETYFWGPNTIVSASTDRSIHLWDTRVGSLPLFALRYHLSPVSDLLLGNRSEPLMVSAGADGSLATWDFRTLSSANAPDSPSAEDKAGKGDGAQPSSRTVRSPIAQMHHTGSTSKSSPLKSCGSVKLARSVGRDDFSFFSVSDDGVVNEWEASGGTKISSHESGHRDAISGFAAYTAADGLRQTKAGGRGGAVSTVGGTITCSWDGTVRLRRLSRKR
ncbi:hypothetical protein ACHAXT_010875 [Thalassiosira profunda]